MITDKNYFRNGAQYPPRGDSARVACLYDYKDLYDAYLFRALRILNPRQEKGPAAGTIYERLDGSKVSFPKYNINLFRKVSQFWASMLFAKPPIVEAEEDSMNSEIDDLVRETLIAAHKVAIDTSRYGTGIYFITSSDDDEVIIDAVETIHWFPIVEPHNQRKIIGDYIAIPYSEKPEEPRGQYGDRLRVSRYLIGEPSTVQTFHLEGNILAMGSQLEEGPVVEQRAVVTVLNGYEREHYGESDYPDLIAPVSEINRRVSMTSALLDRFTNPHMQGPRSAIKTDDTLESTPFDGESRFFGLEEKDQRLEPIVWEVDLTGNFEQMNHMLNYFCAMSNTSMTALGIMDQGGRAAESGSALRKLLFSSFQRLAELRRAHEAAIRRVIRSVYPDLNVTITWPSPFLDGLVEEATAEEIRLRSGASTPAESIARLDDIPFSDAQRIAEDASDNPTIPRQDGDGDANGASMGVGRGRTNDPRPNG